MSQMIVSPTYSQELPVVAPVAERVLLWLCVGLGIAAPLLLVLGADLMSIDAIERAQIIVAGLERLLLLLIGAVLVSVLYLLGVREAQIVASGELRVAGTSAC